MKDLFSTAVCVLVFFELFFWRSFCTVAPP